MVISVYLYTVVHYAIVWNMDGRAVQRSTETTGHKLAVGVPTQTVHVYKKDYYISFVCLCLSLSFFGDNKISLNFLLK